MSDDAIYATARITEYEQIFNQLKDLLATLNQNLDQLEDNRDNFRTLFHYYFGTQWMKDYKLDEEGTLPETLNRGILSEDALYNLYMDLRDLEQRLETAAADVREIENENYQK